MKSIQFRLLSLLLIPLSISAQDAVFSQFYLNPAHLNPALVGVSYNPRIGLNYRNQYPALPNAYVTYSLSYDQFNEKLNSGFGFNLMADQQGDGIYKSVAGSAAYAYNLQVSDAVFVRGGMRGSWVNSRLDWNKLVFLDQLNPLYGAVDEQGNANPSQQNRPASTSVSYLDVGMGLAVFGEKFYAGAALDHINSPSVSLLGDRQGRSTIPLRLTMQAGMEFFIDPYNKVGKKPFISPNVLFTSQGTAKQINIGAYAGFDAYSIGTWFRHAWGNSDAVIFSVGYRHGIVKVGYSYDFTVSQLDNGTGKGAHELGLIFNLDSQKSKGRRYAKRYNDCLKIFR